jgi:hypothetical protein
VDVDSEVLGYVPKAEKYGQASGDCDVPVLPDPEAPPTQAGPAPECSDGVDNDGDRLVDTRDRECTGPSDNSERE